MKQYELVTNDFAKRPKLNGGGRSVDAHETICPLCKTKTVEVTDYVHVRYYDSCPQCGWNNLPEWKLG